MPLTPYTQKAASEEPAPGVPDTKSDLLSGKKVARARSAAQPS
jgi:hypothetical protein